MNGSDPVQDLPVLEAHSRTLDVQDGARLWKGLWGADPTVALDTYYAQRCGTPKTVTFRSDLGALSLQVEPGKEYDFLVRLDGAATCRTRISTLRQPYRRDPSSSSAGPDVIPFRLEHGRIHVEARVNGSRPLDLMFDTGADNLVLHPSALAKGAELEFDGSMLNAGFGGVLTRRTSGGNRLEVAGLTFDSEVVLYIENQSSDSDGILGWIAFEDRVLEIDYGSRVLRVHDSLPAAESFERFPFHFEGTIFAIPMHATETGFGADPLGVSGGFVVDTGATAALHLDSAFAQEHGLYGRLARIGTSKSRGVGPGVLENQVVLLPELCFGGQRLENVPTHLETPGQDPTISTGCLLGMDVLKRFDTILDFPAGQIYLRPSALFAEPFERGGGPPLGVLALGVGVLTLAALLVRAWRRSRRRTS